MATSPQKRALESHRQRMRERGLGRFEVRGLDSDKELIRALAKRLAAKGSEAAALRTEMAKRITGQADKKGGVLAALRRSPLVGADLDLRRDASHGRDVDL